MKLTRHDIGEYFRCMIFHRINSNGKSITDAVAQNVICRLLNGRVPYVTSHTDSANLDNLLRTSSILTVYLLICQYILKFYLSVFLIYKILILIHFSTLR